MEPEPEVEEYKKKTNTGDDVYVRVREDAALAPTALLLGWFGARKRHLEKYGAVYESMGYSTVLTIAPTSVVFSLNQRNVPAYLLSILHILAADVRLTHGGLVIQFFSNGGAMCAPRLSQMFQGAHRDIIGADDEIVVRRVREMLAAVVFDSAPAYLHTETSAVAFVSGLGVRSGSTMETVLRAVFTILVWVQRLLYGDVPVRFWNWMRNANYGVPELYLYSNADVLVDAQCIAALVKERSHRFKDAVREFYVEDAPHVQLLRKYPKEYVSQIRGVNEWGVNAFRRRNQMDDWAPS